MPGCAYCRGARTPCTCATDCGARLDTPPENSHVCARAPADVIAAWLRGTGRYSEDEITRRTRTGADD